VRTGALVTLLAALSAASLEAQTRPLPTDSQKLITDLHRAQIRFEQDRRWRLPLVPRRSGPCDVVVGRMCYWPDDEQEIDLVPSEPERISRDRDRLLETLAQAAEILPTDRWIAGQRVRYAVDAGRLDEARDAAASCRADPAWCTGLRGFVAHRVGQFEVADSLFAVMLRLLPPEQRCEWNDIGVLLEPSLRGRYGRLSCIEQDSVNAVVWPLADPLYLIAGNERRSEHYARYLWSLLMKDSEVTYDLLWNRDLRELLIRYGANERWARTAGRAGAYRAQVVGYQRGSGEPFLPTKAVLEDRTKLQSGEWPRTRRSAPERYSPAYARTWVGLQHQLAVFSRGDSAIVVAEFDPSAVRGSVDTTHAPMSTALAFVPSDGGAAQVMTESVEPGAVARLELTGVRLPGVVSVEALDRDDSVAGRDRYWLENRVADSRLTISDLLLLDAGSAPPSTLDAAVKRARPSALYTRGEPVELFWEIYSADLVPPVEVSISVVQEGRSVFRKAAEWLGLMGSRDTAVRLSFEGPYGRLPARVWARTVTLTLPPDLSGELSVQVEALRRDGSIVRSARRVRVLDREK
jgi:hypothetical protein